VNAPTLVLTANCGVTMIETRLYGPVSAERQAAETAITQRRAEQLGPRIVSRLPPTQWDDLSVAARTQVRAELDLRSRT